MNSVIKKQIVLILLLAILVAGVFFYKNSFGHWPWQSGKVENGQSEQNEEQQARERSEMDRKAVMDDVSQKIAQISPVEPVLGGSWYVLRFWFVAGSNKDFYVEYEDGHIMGRVLLEAAETDGEVSYEVVAYFEPGESDWIKKSGQDTQFGKPLDLYEFENGEWIKKN